MARKVPFVANPLLKVQLPPWRSRVVMFLMACAFLALIGRAIYLQTFNTDFLQREGEMRYERLLELPASRGKIIDRNGQVLAASLPAKAIWAEPKEIKMSKAQLTQLAKLLQMPERDIERKLTDKDTSFTYLKRQVDAETADRIAQLKLAGIHQRKEFKRHYPEGETLAHVVGFTNVEDAGQEGLELAQHRQLSGKAGSRRVIKDRYGRIIEDVQEIREPTNGRDLTISIDSKVQFQAHAALRDAVREHKAKAGAVVVLDVHTGEVLALANWPTYNPNERTVLKGEQLRNRVITDTFEPGSTMKAFSVALALELGKTTPHSVIATAPGRLTIGSATIGDSHPHGDLTVEEVLQKSSNVGTAKLALTTSPQQMSDMFASLGFGQAPQIGFPGAVAGRVRPARTWKPIEQATMSYGHGMSVSLLQMARAYTVFARDGDMVPVTMVKHTEHVVGQQVFKPQTAQAVRKMLEMAAGPEGTAPKAQIAGYRVAGKTGTAHKIESGRYVNKYVASFVGFAPVSDPRIVVAVMIDEPGAGRHYGGEVAAPVFARVTENSLRALRVAPDAPVVAPGSKPAAPKVQVRAPDVEPKASL
jgi:cell division protein FtsI (penicillin-binding protein 3)